MLQTDHSRLHFDQELPKLKIGLDRIETNINIEWPFSEELKKEKGRNLLDWSHYQAHNDVDSISKTYSNKDLIRGSYQLLSKDKRVGWHCDFDLLIEDDIE